MSFPVDFHYGIKAITDASHLLFFFLSRAPNRAIVIIDTLTQVQEEGRGEMWHVQQRGGKHKTPNDRSALSLFHLICPSHSVNLCQLVDCQFGDTFLERSPRVFAAGPPSIAPSNTATNWNVVQLWERSQDLN